MIAFPHCKINLGLYITERREDGYHNLETCFYPVPCADVLEIISAERFEFSTSGIFIPGNIGDNLCLKAYELLKEKFRLPPVRIHLHKVIPTGAGLGGGSSDAAFTLRLLNDIFDLKLTKNSLKEFAAQLGSDCSFFVEDQPMIGMGRGEILRPCRVDLGGKFLVLVKPDVHVSTAEAYNGVVPKKNNLPLSTIVEEMSMEEWRGHLHNDFEESVFQRYPIIGEIKQELYRMGASYACMSGSGSTLVGLFDKPVSEMTVSDLPVLWRGVLPSTSSAS
jgi:4-diphosphocytidyl-2-C-methyl-D-erythritol kinase